MRDDLVRTIPDREAILFAGAGVSMTVGLPSWSTFIEHMAEELGFDRKLSIDPNINYFTPAEYYRLKQGSISWVPGREARLAARRLGCVRRNFQPSERRRAYRCRTLGLRPQLGI
jgi:hypothetical protein